MVSHVELVAEISANHGGSLNKAKELIQSAKESGASRVKLQTYTADTITLNCSQDNFIIQGNDSLWKGMRLYDLYSQASTPWSWHEELFDYARSLGISIFSSPFDVSAVELLEKHRVELYKIASLENGDFELLNAVCRTAKPIYLSTGATSRLELDRTVEFVRNNSSAELTLLLCVSSYPTSIEDMNLSRLNELRTRYGVRVGLSDHCLDSRAAIASVYMGAEVIEKHLTLSRKDKTLDAEFSLEPQEFLELRREIDEALVILGKSEIRILDSENSSRYLRRSLFIASDVKKGEAANRVNIRSVRPSGGMEPHFLENVIGRKFSADFAKGTPLTDNCLD
jgi:N-acetylneuraminate synthase